MKNFSRKFHDINTFMQCPLIFHRYKYKATDHSEQNLTLIRMIKSLMISEMDINEYPNLNAMKTKWDKETTAFHRKGASISQCNNMNINMIQFYDDFKKRFYDKGYRPVALDLPLEYVHSKSVYTSIVPIVLGDVNRNAIPIFASPNNTTRNNDIRFSSFIFRDVFKLNVKDIYNITFPALGIRQYKIKLDELDRAGCELEQVLELMETNYAVPNTNHCQNCFFKTSCRL